MTIRLSVPPPETRVAAPEERVIARKYLASINAMKLSQPERVERAIQDGWDHLGHQLLVTQCITKGFVPSRALIDELLELDAPSRDNRVAELIAQFAPLRGRTFRRV